MPSSLKPGPPSDLDYRSSPPAGAFLLIFLLAALLSCSWLLVRGKIVWLTAPVTRDMLLHGEITHGIARQLSAAPLPQLSANLERGASWIVFQNTGARVRKGCPGWLFLSDEFRLNRNSTTNADDKSQAVLNLHHQLAQRGIGLMLVVVPDKSRIAATQLCGLYRPQPFGTRIYNWIEPLRTQGVTVLDLTSTLQSLGAAAFLRTDTHWSELATRAAALAVDQQVHRLGVRATPLRTYDIRQDPTAIRPGDLVRLAGLDWLPLSLQPSPESVIRTWITPRITAPAFGDSDDLFGNDNLPNIALIGTSFSHTSNFSEFLEVALGADIGNFAKDGGEFSGAAKAYFASLAFKETPPKLIIWEIPERDLQTPYFHDINLE
ncbi:MAG: alginate O-acetyltransferase AlgX-related protein [Pseudomonas sp.]